MLLLTSILYLLLCSHVSANYGPDTKKGTSSIKTLTIVTTKPASKTTSKFTSSVNTSKTTKTKTTQKTKTTTSTAKTKKTSTSTTLKVKSSSKIVSVSPSLGGTGSSGFGSASRPAPSTRTASTGTFIGSVSLGPSTTSISGCPLITLTTTTRYSTTSVYGTTVTITTTPTVTSIDRRSTTKGYTAIFSTTTTITTPSATRTRVILGSAQKTVTAPTPPGFTPVTCEATYYNPTVTRIVTAFPDTSTFTVFSGSPTTSTSVTYVAFFLYTISLTGTDTRYATIFTTVTSTRSSATSTVYAACASNNVVAKYPGGTNIAYELAIYEVVEPLVVDAADAVDCCQLCQANSTCASNSYIGGPGTEVGYCQLYILDTPGTCDPRQQVGIVDDGLGDVANPVVFISNSGCGQFKFEGVSGPEI